MLYEPHTKRLDADEQIDLPWDATGVHVDRDGEAYVVHYLTRVQSDETPIQQQVRERLQEYDFETPEARRRKADEIRESIRGER